MNPYRLVLPYPPTLNSYWRHDRGKNYISKKGRQYRTEVMALIARESLALRLTSKLCVKVWVHVPDRRKRDLDNLLKAPLDALVQAGMIADDSLIDDLHIIRAEPVKGGKLEIRITEREVA
ncbi:RusA family crossover junction endodeoxyribonuclease [Candidatus Regiella endosymbiont of Tuberolachnus salignus]|uniref:RusA family crossover junction endodeoxyribonuclease n=1 Tax=Candidatus Regiella endosymbiont of Tuberolachnus salignus TaxID=3077956 RepID=UPI0030D1CA17